MTALGVILDATGTYKTDDSFDYICKIKIIDDSYNPIDSKKLKQLPFLTIFVFSSKIAESPKISSIGDILYLEDFAFDTHEEKLVRGTLKKYSRWGLLDGHGHDYIFKS